jgi:hypothetical protein
MNILRSKHTLYVSEPKATGRHVWGVCRQDNTVRKLGYFECPALTSPLSDYTYPGPKFKIGLQLRHIIEVRCLYAYHADLFVGCFRKGKNWYLTVMEESRILMVS